MSLEELSCVFKNIMDKAAQLKPQIVEENWRVSDKIRFIRHFFQKKTKAPFTDFFLSQQSRSEIIVIFLAILELMKIGEVSVGRCVSSGLLWIFSQEYGSKIPSVKGINHG